jgi:hypothetical protein
LILWLTKQFGIILPQKEHPPCSGTAQGVQSSFNYELTGISRGSP